MRATQTIQYFVGVLTLSAQDGHFSLRYDSENLENSGPNLEERIDDWVARGFQDTGMAL